MQRRRRSIFLIDRPFQLRFSLYVCSWLFALSLIYPLIIHNLFELFVRHAALDPNGPALEQLKEIRHDVFWLLIFLQLLFLGVTFLISIFVSHRIAGPLYKLRKFFAGAIAGDLNQNLGFRKNDHFQDLAEDYNRLLASIRTTLNNTASATEDASSRIERALPHAAGEGRKELEAALAALRGLKSQRPPQA